MSEHHQRFGSSSTFTTRAFNRERRSTTAAILASGFPYSKKLSAHRSCINALACSSGDGRFLASGGDDCRIHLWDFHQENVNAPSWTLVGPRGNILELAWSSSNRFLYSGGTDETILKYDVSHMHTAISHPPNPGSPSEINRDQNGSIRDISCHPSQDEVFLSASEDGCVIMHDGREPSSAGSRAQATLQLTSEATGVQFHPIMENIFATSDAKGRVCLRDARMAFGLLSQRTQEGVVQTYNTMLSKQAVHQLCNPEASSIAFDRSGSRLAVTMLHYYPTIYSVSDPNPLAICTGRNLPSGEAMPLGERTYSNSCTMKHGSFGGPGLENDEYYSAPSDDFRAYLWKLPDLSDLSERRAEISADDWYSQNFPGTVAFTNKFWAPRYVPVELSTPLCRLTGHQSIVNNALIHPRFLQILTSGIERDILVHSPTASSPCLQDLALTPTTVRSISDTTSSPDWFLQAMTGSHLTMSEDEDTQPRTIAVFDEILRQEGEGDVFVLRRLRSGSGDATHMESDWDSDVSDVSF